VVIFTFGVSFFSSLLITKYNQVHFSDSQDKKHKFHYHKVSRIGGVPIFIAFACSYFFYRESFYFSNLIISSIFVVLAGFLDDLKGGINPIFKLLLTIIAALISSALLGFHNIETSSSLLNQIINTQPIATNFFMILIIISSIHAANMTDGFNGLLSMNTIIILLSYIIIFKITHDIEGIIISMFLISAIFGFFFLNYPKGKIFLGDCGAYLLGFLVVALGLKVVSNQNVSFFYLPCVLGYPAVEILFSFVRKKFIRKSSPFESDRSHLHMLIYGRITPKIEDKVRMNSNTSHYLWALNSLPVLYSTFFYNRSFFLIAGFIAFSLIYTLYYISIIRFAKSKKINL
jgi:UDP-N-acetylmuramyl pentapeptide phosphotransferase/UDP-N-acetylglucosamine-1-phosphate transferase